MPRRPDPHLHRAGAGVHLRRDRRIDLPRRSVPDAERQRRRHRLSVRLSDPGDTQQACARERSGSHLPSQRSEFPEGDRRQQEPAVDAVPQDLRGRSGQDWLVPHRYVRPLHGGDTDQRCGAHPREVHQSAEHDPGLRRIAGQLERLPAQFRRWHERTEYQAMRGVTTMTLRVMIAALALVAWLAGGVASADAQVVYPVSTTYPFPPNTASTVTLTLSPANFLPTPGGTVTLTVNSGGQPQSPISLVCPSGSPTTGACSAATLAQLNPIVAQALTTS